MSGQPEASADVLMHHSPRINVASSGARTFKSTTENPTSDTFSQSRKPAAPREGGTSVAAYERPPSTGAASVASSSSNGSDVGPVHDWLDELPGEAVMRVKPTVAAVPLKPTRPPEKASGKRPFVAAKAQSGSGPRRQLREPNKPKQPQPPRPEDKKRVGKGAATTTTCATSSSSSSSSYTPRRRWVQNTDASGTALEPFVRPFVRSLVEQMCPEGDPGSEKEVYLLNTLLPTVVSCMVRVIESIGDRGVVDAAAPASPGSENRHSRHAAMLMAQQLFRRNPKHAMYHISSGDGAASATTTHLRHPREGDAGTYSHRLVSRLLQEELAAQRLRCQQARWERESPSVWELFHALDSDGDGCLSRGELAILLDQAAAHLQLHSEGFASACAHLFSHTDLPGHGGLCGFEDFRQVVSRWFVEAQVVSASKAVLEETAAREGRRHRAAVQLELEAARAGRDSWAVEQAERKLLLLLKKKGYDLRRAFDALDVNADGTISVQELGQALRALHREMATVAVVAATGEPNTADAAAPVSTFSSMPIIAVPAPPTGILLSDNAVALLLTNSRIDQNHDSRIDFHEFSAFCHRLLVQHGKHAAQRASAVAVRHARRHVWDQAETSLADTHRKLVAMETKFSEQKEEAEQHRNFSPENVEKVAAEIQATGNALASLRRAVDRGLATARNVSEPQQDDTGGSGATAGDAVATAATAAGSNNFMSMYGVLMDYAEAAVAEVPRAEACQAQLAHALLLAARVAEARLAGLSALADLRRRLKRSQTTVGAIHHKWNALRLRMHSNMDKGGGHYQHSQAFHSLWHMCSMGVRSLRKQLDACEAVLVPGDGGERANDDAVCQDVETLERLGGLLAALHRAVINVRSEVQDCEILERCDIAVDSAVRCCSLGQLCRSLAAAACRSLQAQGSVRHPQSSSSSAASSQVAVFFRTSSNAATCMASGGSGGHASVYAEHLRYTTEKGQNKDSVAQEAAAAAAVAGCGIPVGTKAYDKDGRSAGLGGGKDLGFDTLRNGRAIHRKGCFCLPMKEDPKMQHNRERREEKVGGLPGCDNQHHHHRPEHGDSPLAYLFVSKTTSKQKSGASSGPLPARIGRFVNALGEMAAGRMVSLEKLDRLQRVARTGTDLLTYLGVAGGGHQQHAYGTSSSSDGDTHQHLRRGSITGSRIRAVTRAATGTMARQGGTFVGLRVGDSGVRFLWGTGVFAPLPLDVTFMKATDCRTLMAASESQTSSRSATLAGYSCLAWRCGDVVHCGETLGNLSVIIGMAEKTLAEASGADASTGASGRHSVASSTLFSCIHATIQEAAAMALEEEVGQAADANSGAPGDPPFNVEVAHEDQRHHFNLLPLRLFWRKYVVGTDGIAGVSGSLFLQELTEMKRETELIRAARTFLGHAPGLNYRPAFQRLKPRELQARFATCDPSTHGTGRRGRAPLVSVGGRAGEGAGAEAQAGVAVLHRWVIVAELIYSLANAAPGAARRRGSVMAAAVAAAEADHV